MPELDLYVLLPILVGICLITFFLGWFLQAKITKSKLDSAENLAAKITTDAESKAKEKISDAERRSKVIVQDAEKAAQNMKKEKLLEVKDEFYKRKLKFEEEVKRREKDVVKVETRLADEKENLTKYNQNLNKMKQEIEQIAADYEVKVANLKVKEQKVEKLSSDFEELIRQENEKLMKISGLNEDEAKNILFDKLINDVKLECAAKLQEIREQTKLEANRLSRNIIMQGIQRSAADHSVETTVSVLQITSDELKGRIIGKEGRNIRAFEAATGIDIIVDDTPEAIIISGFDPFRREVARVSMERLIADGRIHPARIEEIVSKVEKELYEEIIRVGENTIIEMGIQGVHRDIITLIGRMKYRSSYGQNVLNHSIEVGYLAGIMAAELNLDAQMAKRAGLLHDMGKTIDRNIEGPHAILGYEVAKRCKEHPIVCNAIGAHHDEIPMEHPIAILVQAADAISGARPGARRESVEAYSKRLEKLEAIATSFEGVTKTYAIQAGREVRVIVEQEKVSDILQDQLAEDIAQKIQEEMEYPGQIKVNVIRERRAVAYAK
ncbi:ribonuclease Y [Ignavibacteria bacterium CHB1]|nr:MAG: ribonuclease Y [Chlorobiota bacterium]MBV6398976.1 Ribonuclease Y [Ignavibacteria bacterium]MCC6886186.1 ribonuclease Y [Ignavibacteriales bacterium]MCE7953884.1 ribonuclease Y [Chlorobi bacterium CHB7]MDL1887801.1 ribonuclease Y [Ignavibacteria bacterium CHB1]RIK47777.1 MAG: ribonuclease Y [Ignavibacteriota bacterium]